jgi:hypothetical protein
MSSRRRCYVCDRPGAAVTGPVRFDPTIRGSFLVAQCPRCRRFVCVEHAEGVPASAAVPSGDPVMVAHCPFDIGVPLGSSAP